jgi:hypothetical protein
MGARQMVKDDSAPEFDARPSIRISNSIMESRKVVGLSDKAFRAYIAALCYCSRQETDGKIIVGAAKMIGGPRIIMELVEAKLLEPDGQDFWVHDYLKHQRSAAEIAAFRESRSEDGKRGAHLRWHVPRRQKSKDCEYCLKGANGA